MAPARKRKKTEPTAKNKRQRSEPNLESHSKIVCSAVQQARQSLQPGLREQVRKLRFQLEESRQSGKDPLFLFPQEMWAMIFQQLEDVNDLANCARTCSLFKAIINSSQQELLLGKVIPFVLPYLKMHNYSRRFVDKSLVLCRQVCKRWRAGVDSFANTLYRAPQSNLGVVEKLEKEPQKHFDKTFDQRTRSFCLPVESDSDSDDDQEEKDGGLKKVMATPFLCEVNYDVSSNLSSLSLLDACGHRVGRLNLRQEETSRMSSKQFYASSVAAIKKCKNLQTFCLPYILSLSQNLIEHRLETQVPRSLECLEIYEDRKAVLPVQDGLVRMLSPQIKQIKLKLWNPNLYHTLLWSSLTEIEILKGASAEVLNSLGNMAAPNLNKLSLRLISQCRDLKVLFKAINQFPNLRYLSLTMYDGFDVSNEEDIMNVPVNLLTLNGVTILVLISTQLNTSRILPVLFPAVRDLTLRYGNRVFDERDVDSLPTKAQHIESGQPEFIQIYKNMYKSNIWTILPQLNCLKLEFKNFDKTPGNFQRAIRIDDKKLFTRQGYVLETEEYFVRYQRHLEKIWDVLREESKEKLTMERKSLNKKKKVRRRARNQSTSKVGMTTIFQYVLPWLGKSDALKCRLISKFCRKNVDDKYPQNVKPDTLDKFHLPLDTNSQLQKFYSFIERNKSEPFFAYNSEIMLKSCQTAGIKLLLKEIGKNVRHLTISVKPGVVPGIADMYNLVRECMKQCVNMTSFSLKIHYIAHHEYEKYWEMQRTQKLKKPKNLEYVSTFGPKPNFSPFIRPETIPKLNMLVNDLEWMCEKTIKIRRQENSSTHAYPELKDLTITNLSGKDKLCRAPNLEKLHLCLTMKELSLEYLWEITSKYPKLELLELQFAPECLGITRNIIYDNPHHLIKVTTLKIVVQDKWQVNLDFLAHFPYLKMLQITYGSQAPSMNAENKNDYVVERPDIVDTEACIPDQGFHPRQPDQDFIQLVKYFKDKKFLKHDKDNIYVSNIWIVLRRLQKLEIVFWPDKGAKVTNQFNRKNK